MGTEVPLPSPHNSPGSFLGEAGGFAAAPMKRADIWDGSGERAQGSLTPNLSRAEQQQQLNGILSLFHRAGAPLLGQLLPPRAFPCSGRKHSREKHPVLPLHAFGEQESAVSFSTRSC